MREVENFSFKLCECMSGLAILESVGPKTAACIWMAHKLDPKRVFRETREMDSDLASGEQSRSTCKIDGGANVIS